MEDKTLQSIPPNTFEAAPARFSRASKRAMAGRWLGAVFLAIVGCAFALPALAGPVKPGHSAMWYDPARDGEGWVLEVLSDDLALLYWFTYDEDGDQRWLQGVGEIVEGESGQEIVFPELLVTRGAEFGPGFDPEDVEFQDVGEATMRFDDCDSGTFSYSAFDQSQTIEIQRLSQTMAAGCQPLNGVPGEPIRAYAGESGSWFDLSHDGEGYSLHWLSRDQALLTWYTYDAEGNQYWLIAVGTHEDGRIVFENLQSTRGARFGEAFDPDDVEFIDWGSLVVELECAEGTATYESVLPEFGSGEFELTRLTQLKGLACPWERPRLWDLYEITWKEIPIAQGDAMDSNNIQATEIAEDGTVAAVLVGNDDRKLAIWQPGAEEWMVIPRPLNGDAHLSADGKSVVSAIEGEGFQSSVERWTQGSGWSTLPGLIYDENLVLGVSRDFTWVLGRGNQTDEQGSHGWIWSLETGQVPMPTTDEIPGVRPTEVSNDGNTVAGWTLRPPPEGSSFPRRIAIRWQDGGDPKIMRDETGTLLQIPRACNTDCSLIYGSGHTDFDPDHPHVGEAWLWQGNKNVHYLGALDDALASRDAFRIGDSNAKGDIVVGSYPTINEVDGHQGEGTVRGFIWTQRTGVVSVRDLIKELGIGDDEWQTMSAKDVSPSGDKILLSGFHFGTGIGSSHNRAAILELDPKEDLE